MSFEMTTLGEFATVQGGYAYKSQDFKSTGEWSVLKIKNVRNGHVSYDDTTFVSTEVATATSKWTTKPGDILISMTGSGPSAPESLVGRAARVWKGEKSALINQRVGRLILKESSNIDLDFLFYLLSLKESQDFLVSNSTGSANQVNISAKTIESVPCPKIDHDASTDITSILLSLDGKIRLLRETNTTLEAIAQALFKSWFVDFDPVRAKQQGLEPEGMDAETAELFPDSFEKSELGLLPKGWRASTLDGISTVGIGKTPPRKEQHWFSENPNDVRWVSIRDMGISGAYISTTNEFLTAESIERFNVRVVPDNTVMLSFKMTIGRVAISDGEMTTNEAIAHFKLDRQVPLSTEFIYLHLRQFDYSTLSSTSSIADAVNSKTVKSIPILIPAPKILVVFQDQVSVIFQKIKIIEQQIKTLATLRDTLLPRLISGQLRLPDAEALIEETTA
ncbi:MAG: restriction endonuclease subunit S [Methylobacter sp.]|nr:restriction endonuclease subunit S [Methylobacter sp.]